MGYYTHYRLEWDDVLPEPQIRDVITAWRLTNEEAHFCLDEDGSPEEAGKWYDHEQDVRELSRALPAVLFTLHCRGECGAQWRVVAKNGRSFKINPVLHWPKTEISKPEQTSLRR